MIARPYPTCGETRCAVSTTAGSCPCCGRKKRQARGESIPGPGFNMAHPLVEVRSHDGVPYGSVPRVDRSQDLEDRHRIKQTAKEQARLALSLVLQDRRSILSRESRVHRSAVKCREVASNPRLYRKILSIVASHDWMRRGRT